MTHPTINHIRDVLPSIEGRTDFIVAYKGDYKVIDYVYALSDSFDDPIRAECRGLKFYSNGSIAARPLHKFKNIGEAPETQAHVLDFTRPHVVMEKLDGSMIHAALIEGDIVFMTRMGRTDVAAAAERHLTSDVAAGCGALLSTGYTPIFEWTAPDNRIVIRYDDSRLTLLAIRNTVSGEYCTRKTCQAYATAMDVPLVTVFDSAHATGADFATYARAVMGFEGFVVRFENGLWVKAKGEDYVLKHKAKDSILQEKNVLALVLSGGLDDVLPLLNEPDAKAARAYRDVVEAGLAQTAGDLRRFVADNDNVPQREFATEKVSSLPKPLRSLAFTIRKGVDADEAVRTLLMANTSGQARVDEFRDLHGARWAI